MAEAAPEGGRGARLVGKVVTKALDSVRPNPWNPNFTTPEQMESIQHGFRQDGWLVSQALLVWGTDETGARRDVIIDGEQRWTAGLAVGLTKGPMVFLDGLPEAEAKKLTVKMNQKRGQWDEDRLGELLRELAAGEKLEAVDLGFGSSTLDELLAFSVPPPPDVEAGGSPPDPGGSDAAGGDAGGGQAVIVVSIACADVSQAARVADACRAEGWTFTEELR